MSTGQFPPFDFDAQSITRRFQGRGKWIILIAAIAILLVLASFARSIYTDFLWYGELGFRGIYIKVLTTRIVLFAVGFVVTAILLALSLILINRKTSGPGGLPIPEDLAKIANRLVLIVSIIAIVVIGLIMGSFFSSKWELFLRFTNAASFGVTDPLYGKDLSFYIFELPTYSFIQGWALALGIVIGVATGVLAFANFTLRGVNFTLTPAIRNQLIIIGAFVVIIVSIGLWIDRLELVHSDGGVVYGATYADVYAKKVALLILSILGLLVAAIMVVGALIGKMRISIAPVGLWVILIFALASAWPSVVQQFSVNPQEFVKEKQYIEDNIEYTRIGFGLNAIDETFYETEGDITSELIEANLKTVENIRLWDYRPLTNVYKQIQLIRPYYDFKDADVDRYTIDGEYRQVLLAAREVAPEKLADEAQTWVNRKLFYTHGIGIAMSPATEFTSEGRPIFFAKDIPADGQIPISSPDPESIPDVMVNNPRIYYGENTHDYVIVNTNTEELDYQTGEGDLIKASYQGDGGVSVGSWFRKLIYAWEMRDINIFISSELNNQSRIQYRRAIQERVTEVAPFLSLDKDPYVVAGEGQLYWMQDAYTISNKLPYSDPEIDEQKFTEYNYIRNSVKIVVDAYTGDIDFYLWDENDPVAMTYKKIFPKLFTDASEMPESIRSHVRYPQGLFSIQASKYIKYHMDDPQHFYGNEDLWAIPQEKFGQGDVLQEVEPYYVIMKLPGHETEEFVQLIPYTPTERPNMVGWLAARSDGEQYGNLVAYNFPKDRQVDGPEQVEARIDNDQDISAWFTLRCSEGSTCIRGNLLVIPIGDSLLYAEPIYIQAEGVSFPELKKVILATSERIVMGDSLDDALYQLTGDSFEIMTPDSDDTLSSTSKKDSNTMQIGDTTPEEVKQSIERLRTELDALEDLIQMLNQEQKGD